jgi:lipoic acid synthetase
MTMKKQPASKNHLPPWFKVRIERGPHYLELKKIVKGLDLHTVCEEARCPNIWDCWNRRTATFMILGDVCTRSCGFCAVKTGKPTDLDLEEPERVARAVKTLDLKHAVITSVNRDELSDGGAEIFARTIRSIREQIPNCRVEVLIPDFKGSHEALMTVLEAEPDILNHNTETVPRLYSVVRPQAKYLRSLELLCKAKGFGAVTKTGLMLGLGESMDEVRAVMWDLVAIQCDILTLGQYLQPTKDHLPVVRYYHPDEFLQLKIEGLAMGFGHVEAAPLVRSSYHADEQPIPLSGGV